MKKIIIIGAIGAMLAGALAYNYSQSRCTGSSGCTACKTCNYCKHCNEGKGTCGVCS